MSTPKPGEIRCPTCHRSTPPAAFCTQCGAAIPPDARVRPRGMDRQELQDRIRQRRAGGDPYRRGSTPDDALAGEGTYGQFAPEPEDATARRSAAREPAQRREDFFEEHLGPPPDITREPEPDAYSGWSGREAAAPESRFEDDRHEAENREPYREPAPDEPRPDHYDDDAYPYDPGYPYEDEWGGGRRRGSGLGPVVILGFLALGVLALLGGAVLAGVFDPGGVATPTQTPTLAAEPTAEPTEAATESLEPSPSGGGTAPPTDGPVTFPDGFVGDVEPCATEAMDFDGCDVDGSTIEGDQMWAWLGFEDASGDDELVINLQVGGQTIDQQQRIIGQVVSCPNTCTGYLRQGYTGLNPGDYELVLERNGEFADRETFTVGG